MQVTSVRQLQALVRGRRHDLREGQAQIAGRAQVSRKWLSEFERGATVHVELPLLLRVLTALDLTLEVQPRELVASQQLEVNENHVIELDEVLDEYNRRGPGNG